MKTTCTLDPVALWFWYAKNYIGMYKTSIIVVYVVNKETSIVHFTLHGYSLLSSYSRIY